jgi:hypothetical protein
MKPTQWKAPDLADAFKALREAESRIETPAHVEAAVLAAWDTSHSAHTGAEALSIWHRVVAVAAAVVITVSLGQLGRQLQRGTQASTDSVDNDRTLLVVGEPILQGEPIRVVRMRVPASTLTGLGIRPATGNAAAHVDVDVLVGEDGIARAIRVGM